IASRRIGPIDDDGTVWSHHHVQRVQVAVYESIAGQRRDPDPWWGRDSVEPLVEIGEQMSRPSEREWRLADRVHHRRTLEAVHDEIAVAGVVDVRTRISVGSD